MTDSRISEIPVLEMPSPYANDKWLLFLGEHLPAHRERVNLCRTHFSGWVDGGCRRVRYRVSLCRDRVACFVCAKVYTIGLVDDVMEVFGDILKALGMVNSKGRPSYSYAGFEFTVPPRYQRVIAARRGSPAILRRLAWETVQEVVGEATGLTLAASTSAHFWHSSNPAGKPYPHVHGTLLPFGFDCQGRLVKLSLFRSLGELDQLRVVWQRKVKEVFGDDHIEGDWVMHWNFAYGEGHLRHRLEYQYRRPMEDLYREVVNGPYPYVIDSGWVKQLLVRPKNEKQVTWHGWMADGVRGRWLKKIQLTLLSKKERDKRRRVVYCPRCGERLRPTGEVVSKFVVEHRKGIVVRRVRPPGGGIRSWSSYGANV